MRIIRLRPFNAGSCHPPPSEMPATQSILNIGGIFETVLLIAEKKVHLLYERVFAAICCINIHPR